MQPRLFTLEEANAFIPRLTELFAKIFELDEIVSSLNKDISLLHEIWGSRLSDQRNEDHALYKEKLRLRERKGTELQAFINDIQNMGCVVKDLKLGLVDFLFEHDGDHVFLCWKHREERIAFWHPQEGNFQTRRPLEELLERKGLFR